MRALKKLKNKLNQINAKSPDLKKNIRKFGLFMLGGLTLTFLMPNRAIDPWNLINLQLMAIIVMTVMVIQFVSYVILEVWKTDGLLFMGTLVGIVNSNAINGPMASITKQNPRLSDHAAAAVVCGNLAMLVRNIVVISTISIMAAKFVLVPLIGMVLAGIASVYYKLKTIKETSKGIESEKVGNPFEIKTAFQFAGMMTLVTVLGFGIHSLFGDLGLYITAFVSVYAAGGPIIFSAVMMAAAGTITPMTAAIVVLIASFSSVTNDAILQLMCGAKSLAWSFVRISVPIVVVGVLIVCLEIVLF